MSKNRFSCGDGKKVVLMEPYDHIHGKIGKNTDVVMNVYRNGNVSIYRQGKRDYAAHPETDGERQQKAKFSTVAKTVAEKKQLTSPTYAQDIAAYATADKEKYPTFRSFLWAREWNK